MIKNNSIFNSKIPRIIQSQRNLSIIASIKDTLNNLTKGIIKLEDAIAKLEALGLTPQKQIKDGVNILLVEYFGDKFSANYIENKPQNKPLEIKSGLNNDLTTLAELSVKGYINSSLSSGAPIVTKYANASSAANNSEGIKNPSEDSRTYTKKSLILTFGFSEAQIDRYFRKVLVLYRLDYSTIAKDFPGLKIKTAEDLKNAIMFNTVGKEGTSESFLANLENKVVSKEELESTLNEYIVLFKKELDSQDLSVDFTSKVMEFAKKEVLNNLDTNPNLKESVQLFKNYVEELLSDSNPVYNMKKGFGKNKKTVNLFNEKVSSSSFNKKLKKITESGNLQAQFFSQMFSDTLEKLNLTEDEKEIFIQRVFDAIARKIGGFEKGDSDIDFSKISELDKNKNGSWLEEFDKILQQEASKINTNVDRNPKTINAKDLTNWLGRLNPNDFVENLDNLLLSNDGGIRKFAQMIQETFSKFRANSKYDQEQLVGYIFWIMNDTAGNEISKTLKNRTIKELNQNDIFGTLEKILNSKRLEQLYELDYDGEIDDFRQGTTGDCWLLSGIIALDATALGHQILEDALTFNRDNSVTVTFKGLNVSYTITPEEILEAQALSELWEEGAYSIGDNDVLIFELATEKLRRDITSGKVKMPLGGYYTRFGEDNGDAGGGITGGWVQQFFYFLTGKKSDMLAASSQQDVLSESKIKAFCLSYFEEYKKGNISMSFSSFFETHSATTVDGKEFKVDLTTGGHAFAITNITEDTITIVNPWYPDEEYTLSWAEFAKFGIFSLEAVNLS